MSARRLLIVPLLSPLLAVILLGALNPRPSLSFRVLTWVTPRAPLGLWLGTAALGGAALSGAGTALALRQGQGSGLGARRRVTTRTSRPWAQPDTREDEGWESFASPSRSGSRAEFRRESWAAGSPSGSPGAEAWRGATVAAVPPSRSPGEPPPTVDVPFRILHRPSAVSTAREREPMPVGVDDGWEGEGAVDDW